MAGNHQNLALRGLRYTNRDPCFFCYFVLLLILLKNQRTSMQRDKIYYILPILFFVLSACGGERTKFVAGDMKKDFCGTHLNYQYCECAFSGNFCEEIAMNRSDSEKHAKEEYNKWVAKELQNFSKKCENDGGLSKGYDCKYCSTGKKYTDGKCKKVKILNPDLVDDALTVKPADGKCALDSDCISSCEGNIQKKTLCNPQTNICEQGPDVDCKSNTENFAEFVFPMICAGSECVRDIASIQKKRSELELENVKNVSEQSALDTKIETINKLIPQSESNCGAEDEIRNEAKILEFASLAKNFLGEVIPEPIGVSADIFNMLLKKMSAYAESGSGKREEFEEGEFRDLNCELNNYFKKNIDELKLEKGVLDKKVDDTEIIIKKLPVS